MQGQIHWQNPRFEEILSSNWIAGKCRINDLKKEKNERIVIKNAGWGGNKGRGVLKGEELFFTIFDRTTNPIENILLEKL